MTYRLDISKVLSVCIWLRIWQAKGQTFCTTSPQQADLLSSLYFTPNNCCLWLFNQDVNSSLLQSKDMQHLNLEQTENKTSEGWSTEIEFSFRRVYLNILDLLEEYNGAGNFFVTVCLLNDLCESPSYRIVPFFFPCPVPENHLSRFIIRKLNSQVRSTQFLLCAWNWLLTRQSPLFRCDLRYIWPCALIPNPHQKWNNVRNF